MRVFRCGKLPRITPPVEKRCHGSPGALCRAESGAQSPPPKSHLAAGGGLGQERGPESYFTSCRRGMEGAEGERISTPLAVAYFRSGQAVLIFFNSRRQSVRKSRTI